MYNQEINRHRQKRSGEAEVVQARPDVQHRKHVPEIDDETVDGSAEENGVEARVFAPRFA